MMKYIDILPNLIKKYNNTYPRSIKCTPAFSRAPSSYQHVYVALYNRREVNDVEAKPKFKIGDRLRILKKKKTFEKVFTPNWTEELFIVHGVRLAKPVTYNIKDIQRGDHQRCFLPARTPKSKPRGVSLKQGIEEKKKEGRRNERSFHIENQDKCYHPRRSYLLVQGNLLLQLVKKSSVNNPGSAGVLMGIAKYLYDYAYGTATIQCWTPETSDGVLGERALARRKEYIIEKSDPHGSFSFAIELENLFGFCED